MIDERLEQLRKKLAAGRGKAYAERNLAIEAEIERLETRKKAIVELAKDA